MILWNFISRSELLKGTPWVIVAFLLVIYLAIRTLIFQGGTYLFVTRVKSAVTKRVFRMPFAPGQLPSEIRACLLTICIDGVFTAALLKWGPSIRSGGNLLFTFLLSFAWFEIWFYASHRLLHLRSLYFIHRQHHVALVTSPFSAASFSALERLIFLSGGLGFLTLAAVYIPLSPWGAALYLFCNYLLNIFGHMNVEVVPPAVLDSRWGRVFNAPTYHSLHHARFIGHFGLFTPYLDCLFRSNFSDYGDIQRLAYEGEGPTSLGFEQKGALPNGNKLAADYAD